MFETKNEDTGNRATIKLLKTELKDLRRMLQEQMNKTTEYKDEMIKQGKASISRDLEFTYYKLNNPEKDLTVFELGAEILLKRAKHELKDREELMAEIIQVNYAIKSENRSLKKQVERLTKLLEERSGTTGGC